VEWLAQQFPGEAMGICYRPISPGSPWQNPNVECLIGTVRRAMHSGICSVFGDMITVTAPEGRQETTQLGGSSPESLARMMLIELEMQTK
jgi:hypothetical protein